MKMIFVNPYDLILYFLDRIEKGLNFSCYRHKQYNLNSNHVIFECFVGSFDFVCFIYFYVIGLLKSLKVEISQKMIRIL